MDDNGIIIADGLTDVTHIPSGMRYVLGKDGVYIQRDTALFTTSVRGEPELDSVFPVPTIAKLKTPKIPAYMIAQALGFFVKVVDMYDGESALVLVYDKLNRRWGWYCPEQKVVGMRVEFEYPLDLPPGVLAFGDIHSHPGMAPTPSYTDIEDEKFRDGVHLIAGYVRASRRPAKKGWFWEDKEIELSATFAVDGARVPLEPLDVLEAIPEPLSEFPEEWLGKVRYKKHSGRYYGGVYEGY